MRVEFDVAAKYNGISLNNQPLPGSCLMNDLTRVFIHFCIEVAFSADIEGMFYHISATLMHWNSCGGLIALKTNQSISKFWSIFSVPSHLPVVLTRPWITLLKTTKIIPCKKWWKQFTETSVLQDSVLWNPINHATAQLCWYILMQLCCSIIHSVDEIGAIHCSFVMGKAHNAPIREWTIST